MIKLMAHGGEGFNNSRSLNTMDTVKKSLINKFDIIELDIRKSKEGILYCYHGNFFEMIFYKFFKKRINFSKKKYLLLKDVLNLISKKAIICLDIKDNDITKDEIVAQFKGIGYSKVYIMSFSKKKLIEYSGLPNNWIKVYASPLSIYCDINFLRNYDISIVGVSILGLNKKNIKNLKDSKINLAIAHWGLSKKEYLEFCLKYNSDWISPKYL